MKTKIIVFTLILSFCYVFIYGQEKTIGVQPVSPKFRIHTISIIQKRKATDVDSLTLQEISRGVTKLLNGYDIGMTYSVSPSEANINNILGKIDKIEADDILLFYFSGEGQYTNKDENSPLQIILGKDKEQKIDTEEIVKKIRKQKAKTSIVLIECSLREVEKNDKNKDLKHDGVITKTNAKTLFLSGNNNVFYMTATSPPKQPIHRHPQFGSYFLQSFKINLFDELASDSLPTWDNIEKNIQSDVSALSRGTQKPSRKK